MLGVGEALARVVAFVTMLVVARRLGPSAYGVVGVSAGILLYLTQLADGGIELVGIPAVATDRKRAKSLGSATLTYRLLAATALTLFVIPVGVWIMPQPDGTILATYALALVFTSLSTRWLYLGVERPATVAVARCAGEVVALGLMLVMMKSAADLSRVPVTVVIGTATASLIMLLGLPRLGLGLRPSLEWSRCRPLFVSARHLVLFTMLGLLLFNFDLIFLRYMRGEATAGYYAAAYTFISFAANVIVAYAHSVLPVLSRLRDNAAAQADTYVTAMAQSFAVALPAAIGGLLVAGSVISLIFGAEYAPAVPAMQWLLLTIPVAAVREIAVVALIANGGEKRLVQINAITAVANIALNVALVPVWGLLGAAVATFATEFVRLGLGIRAASQVGVGLPNIGRFVKPTVAAAAMWGAITLGGIEMLPLVIIVGVFIYAAVLVVTGAITLSRGAMPRLTV